RTQARRDRTARSGVCSWPLAWSKEWRQPFCPDWLRHFSCPHFSFFSGDPYRSTDMRKLIVPAFISLDGVMQAPGGPQEDISGGFAHGGWVWPYADESDEVMGGVFERPFELLLGRRTYDIFAAYWPHVAEDAPHRGIADLFNGTAKHVATHHPDTLEWRDRHALGSDIIATVRELKRADGPDLVTQGSSDLVHQLLATHLVDE